MYRYCSLMAYYQYSLLDKRNGVTLGYSRIDSLLHIPHSIRIILFGVSRTLVSLGSACKVHTMN